jgi:hypothetical protein
VVLQGRIGQVTPNGNIGVWQVVDDAGQPVPVQPDEVVWSNAANPSVDRPCINADGGIEVNPGATQGTINWVVTVSPWDVPGLHFSFGECQQSTRALRYIPLDKTIAADSVFVVIEVDVSQ